MAYGASYEYTNAYTTNKSMQLFCVDVIATFIKVAAILKKKTVTGILYLILFGFSDTDNMD